MNKSFSYFPEKKKRKKVGAIYQEIWGQNRFPGARREGSFVLDTLPSRGPGESKRNMVGDGILDQKDEVWLRQKLEDL